MKEIFKSGMSLFGRLIVVTIMCFFICISMSVLCTAAFTKNIGYEAYGYKDDSNDSVHLYTYYSADGDDTQKQEYENQGYTVTTSSLRSQLSGTGNAVFLTVTQIFCILILIAFIYPNLWQLGAKDSNLVRFKHKADDSFKGLKIGAVASAPSLIILILFLICGLALNPSLPTALYRFINCPFYSLINVIFGSAAKMGDVKIYQYVLLLLLLCIVPAVAYVAYLLGYKDISLGEKFIYKKNKTK